MWLHYWVILCICCVVQHTSSKQKSKDNIWNDILDILEDEMQVEEREQEGEDDEKVIADWMKEVDKKLAHWNNGESLINWDYMTDLTDDNAKKLEDYQVKFTDWLSEKQDTAKDYLKDLGGKIQDDQTRRMFRLFLNGSETPVSKDSEVAGKISSLRNELESIYGTTVIEHDGKKYNIEPELLQVMQESRDYDTLLWAWQSWRSATGPKMKPLFTELVDNLNKASKENGFADCGELWRIANYEDYGDKLEDTVDGLYQEIQEFYKLLHAYVRKKLLPVYPDHIDPKGPIPAHLLGNMWAQEWLSIYEDILVPFPDSPSYDVTDNMVKQGYTELKLFKVAEEFFTSIGLEPMTPVFWEKSMIVKPTDRTVQCHASAEDFFTDDDFRIKMCAEVTQDYFQTVHHEMGHIQYFMQYRHQPTVMRTGANAGFHEAVGDTIALSVVTPRHLEAIGLLDPEDAGTEEQKYEKDINFLMSMALKKVAFLPFGYMIDKYRWNVFRGVINENNYNAKWWEYRQTYQGVSAPVPRSEKDFDPGAKYHVAANVPYMRYFISFITQFQFHQSLCEAAEFKGPLHECDIYNSKKAGDLLKNMLSLGASQPWEVAMETMTKQKKYDTGPILEYFKPLILWLQKETAGEKIGWTD